jgi:hypothetical protein
MQRGDANAAIWFHSGPVDALSIMNSVAPNHNWDSQNDENRV